MSNDRDCEHCIHRVPILNKEEGVWEGADCECWNCSFSSREDAEKAIEENKALRLLLDWVLECDVFGYDNIPEEYEKYKDKIKDMSYKEGLIYIALMESRGSK